MSEDQKPLSDLEAIELELEAISTSGAIQPVVEGPARRLQSLIRHMKSLGLFQNIEERFCRLETKLGYLFSQLNLDKHAPVVELTQTLQTAQGTDKAGPILQTGPEGTILKTGPDVV